MPSHTIKIHRTKYLTDRTLGEIWFDNIQLGYTIEQPWAHNAKNHSCIPVGNYKLFPHNSVHEYIGNTVVFYNPELDVYIDEDQIPAGKTGRSSCLIHVGNYVSDVQGCVAVGAAIHDFGAPHGLGVTSSHATMDKLKKLWGNRQGLVAVIS
jgi:hypothetical protein